MKKIGAFLCLFLIVFEASAQFRNLILRPRHGQIIGKWQVTNQPLRAWMAGDKMYVIQGEMDNFVVRGANMLIRRDVVSDYKKYYQYFAEPTANGGLEMPKSFEIPKFCIAQTAADGTIMILCGQKAIDANATKPSSLPQAENTTKIPQEKTNSLPQTQAPLLTSIRRGKNIEVKFSGFPKVSDGFNFLRADGSVKEVLSRLSVNNGRLSDEFWNRPFMNDRNYEKGFYIGLGEKPSTVSLQNLDVSELAGFDLSVIEVYTEKGKHWNSKNWLQQYITVPGKRPATDTVGNAIYYWNPSSFVSESILPDFYDSFPEFSLPKGKIVKFSYVSGTDINGEKAFKRGVNYLLNAPNPAQKSWMDYDSWLYEAGCPKAYTTTEEAVNQWLDRVDANILRRNFANVVAPNVQTGYLSLNFEPIGVWNSSKNIGKIGFALQELKQQKARGEFAIWSLNPRGMSRAKLEGEKDTQGFSNVLKWQGGGWEAYNRTFPNLPTRNVWNSVRESVTISQVGNYCNDLRNVGMIYHLMTEGLVSKKIEPNKKALANIWHEVETLDWQLGEQTHRTSNGEVIRVKIKPIVPPDLMQSWGVWGMWLDGIDLWSDPNTKVDNPDLWGSKGMDLDVEKYRENRFGDRLSSYPFQSQKNIDWLMAGVWAMSMNKDILEANTPIEYPDITLPDGRGVTGDDKLPTEAFIRGYPLVMKKRDNDSNDILYTAYWGHNPANKAVKIVVDGQEIVIRGQYTSVVRVKR
ncbi:hypothetical protein Emtol_1006 [Emticicia oligotrophica DSM 17448]|uniref:DUF5703 domain-containing protein n=1 Tax=Emticicia oligotrophica (strain DSM 17448 / CIP 109782 / MTCC 6937 / GPTSA100-15) TaxID=929562 RepID=A0ABN4AJ50_EMTOG|nr:hypothetical protein [Emticicia oligotrophica]AFK02157.1 hypothetical protein Emtol_1006 [Emticicia oligotrophica DSM 17448]